LPTHLAELSRAIFREARVRKTRAADDFAAIRARMEEIRRERAQILASDRIGQPQGPQARPKSDDRYEQPRRFGIPLAVAFSRRLRGFGVGPAYQTSALANRLRQKRLLRFQTSADGNAQTGFGSRAAIVLFG
jgi:hypothetical protein